MDYAYNNTILPHIYLYFVKHFVIVIICYINKIIFFNFAFPGRQGQVVSFFVPDDNAERNDLARESQQCQQNVPQQFERIG